MDSSAGSITTVSHSHSAAEHVLVASPAVLICVVSEAKLTAFRDVPPRDCQHRRNWRNRRNSDTLATASNTGHDFEVKPYLTLK